MHQLLQPGGHRLVDTVGDVLDHVLVVVHGETDHGEGHHEDRNHRQHAEVGDRGGVVIAVALGERVVGADQVIEPRILPPQPGKQLFLFVRHRKTLTRPPPARNAS